ncbi:MAG TPA: phosphatidate cytidylyltransferase [Acidimicrobiales bacterium]|nr:phosphatidate cytidylyltransferase [Acidimicrobiales bacterium]
MSGKPEGESRDRAATRPADERASEFGPPTIELRIDAVEAAVAAGLVSPSPDSSPAPPDPTSEPESTTGGYELPDWSDPPTGAIPRVLLEDPEAIDLNEPILRKPTWRAHGEEWNEEEFDLSLLAAEDDDPVTGEIAGTVAPAETPFGFSALDEVDEDSALDDVADEEETPWVELFDPAVPERRRHAADHRRHRARHPRDPNGARLDEPTRTARRVKPPSPRNVLVATATGLELGLLVVFCLLGGTAPTDGLIAAIGTVAAGEFFGVLRRNGFRPATLIGLVAVPAAIVAAYSEGPAGIAVVVAFAFIATGAWFLRRRASPDPIVDAAITLFVICWVGVLGGCAGLLLAPSIHPFGDGIALVFGVIACTVGHDVGSFLVGSKFGRHKIAPHISPGKTIEGLIGGTVVDMIVAVALISRFHPLSIGTAALLGIVVAIFAPLGDLIESMVKRSLGVKDMGSLLPAHGGVFDRVDAMLVVMPAAYVLFRIAHVL